ncbi:hypothetical protein FS749_012090, partial [Ceratobasidium sp. UAMH 11750]
MTNLAPTEKQVKLALIVHEFISPVCAIAFNADEKLLALGYSNYVAIWRKVMVRRVIRWESLGCFRIQPDETPAVINSLHFFGPDKHLFVGSKSGSGIWSLKGGLTPLDDQTEMSCKIGNLVLASDDSMIVVSTLDQSILIYPFSPQCPITTLARKYLLESGQEWGTFEPYTPVALLKNRTVVCGTLDGTVAMLKYDGQCLQKLTRVAHCTRAIVTFKDTIYILFNSAVGVVSLAAYINNDAQEIAFEENPAHPPFYRFNEVYKPPVYSPAQGNEK